MHDGTKKKKKKEREEKARVREGEWWSGRRRRPWSATLLLWENEAQRLRTWPFVESRVFHRQQQGATKTTTSLFDDTCCKVYGQCLV